MRLDARIYWSMRHLVLLLGILLLISACGAGPEAEDENISANIAGYNSTENSIYQFYVNGHGGSGIRSYGDGGFVCCARYPRHWRPGLTAKVRWTTSSAIPGGDPTQTWHEAIVPIEQYDAPGSTMNVHFLPGHLVRILIWNGYPGSEGYQGPGYPKAPVEWPPKQKSANEGA